MFDIGTTGAEVLRDVLTLLANRGVSFGLVQGIPHLPSLMERYDFVST